MLDRLFPSLRSFVRSFALASPGGSAFDRGGVSAGIVPAMPDRSVVNAVLYEDARELEGLLGELADAYTTAGVRAWTVWTRGEDESLLRTLAGAGHVLDGEPLVMGRALEGIEPPEPGVLELAAEPSREAVAAIRASAFGWEEYGPGALQWYDGYHPYVALLDGRPVCTLGIHDHEGDAHVTLVGTLEEARGRGLASMLMRHALADARERGCVDTTLIASKLGAPVYERLGYRGFGRLQMWERRKPRA